jgi:PAS domain S-box-containing protein
MKDKVDPEDVAVLRILADQASLALLNVRLFERVKRQAKRAEASESRFRRIMDTAHDMIISYDHEGNVVFTNNAFRESNVYTEEGEVIDIQALDKVHPDDQARMAEVYLALQENRPNRGIEYRIRDSNGEWLIHNLNVTVVTNGKGEAEEFVLFIRDVTMDRQREQQVIRRNKELEIFNSLITNLTSDIEYEEMITRSLGIIAEYTGADMLTFISLTEPIPGRLNVISNLWVPPEFESFLSIDLPRSPETELISMPDVQVMSDLSMVPERYRGQLDKYGIQTILSIPVMLRGKAVGYVVAGVKGPIDLDDESTAILHAIGDQLGMVLEIAKLKHRNGK